LTGKGNANRGKAYRNRSKGKGKKLKWVGTAGVPRGGKKTTCRGDVNGERILV